MTFILLKNQLRLIYLETSRSIGRETYEQKYSIFQSIKS